MTSEPCSPDSVSTEIPSSTIQHDFVSLRAQNPQRTAVSFPTELLIGIFGYACALTNKESECWLDHTDDVLRKRRGAIAATCCRWREIALATQSLWNHIVVILTGHRSTHDRLRPALPLLHLEFERSGHAHLNLKISVRSCLLTAEEYYTALHAAFPRCEALAISLDDEFYYRDNTWHLLHLATPNSFPHLKSLTFFTPAQSDIHLRFAPFLQHLRIDRAITLLTPSKLTSLELRISSGILATAFDLMESHQDTLEYLKWTFSKERGPPKITRDAIHLPALKRLSMVGHAGSKDPFSVFIAPGLTHLQISQYGLITPPAPNQFPKIRYLSCAHVNYKEEWSMAQVFETLQDMRTLEELHFDPAYDLDHPEHIRGDSVSKWLSKRNESGDLERLPRLRKLTGRFKSVPAAGLVAQERMHNDGEKHRPQFTMHLVESSRAFQSMYTYYPKSVFRRSGDTDFLPAYW